MIDQTFEQPPLTHKFPNINWQPDQNRFQILLVKAGFAKISSLSIYPPYKEIPGQDDLVADGKANMQKVMGTVDELRYLGFAVDFHHDDQGAAQIIFANKMVDINEYEKSRLSDKLSDENQGQVFGIPKTAIEAYPNEVFKMNNLPPEVADNPLSELLPFLLSKNHYKEEWNEFVGQANKAAVAHPNLIKSLQLSQFFNLV